MQKYIQTQRTTWTTWTADDVDGGRRGRRTTWTADDVDESSWTANDERTTTWTTNTAWQLDGVTKNTAEGVNERGLTRSG